MTKDFLEGMARAAYRGPGWYVTETENSRAEKLGYCDTRAELIAQMAKSSLLSDPTAGARRIVPAALPAYSACPQL